MPLRLKFFMLLNESLLLTLLGITTVFKLGCQSKGILFDWRVFAQKSSRPWTGAFRSVSKKPMAFLHASKRHIFCENKFSRKISLRSSKSLMAQAFLMAIIQLEAGLAPSSSPAARLYLLSSIGSLIVSKKLPSVDGSFSIRFTSLRSLL